MDRETGFRDILNMKDKRAGNMRKGSIILIGMPGSGKSTIGVLLAKALCMRFVDSDLVIQNHARMPLQRIIETRGTDGFAEEESKALLSIHGKNQVIATGGSAIFHETAMEYLKANGTIVYLCPPYAEIEKRLWNIATRGIVLKPGQTLRDVYSERKPYYEKYADITIYTGKLPPARVVQKVIQALGERR